MKASISQVNTFPRPSTSIQIKSGRVDLGVGANFIYCLLDSNEKVMFEGNCDLTTQQYNDWTGDDEHVVRSVAANMQLTFIALI